MFDALLNWLGAAWNALWEWIKSFSDGFWKFVAGQLSMYITVIGAIISSLYTAYALVSTSLTWLDQASAKAIAVAGGASAGGTGPGLVAWLNYVFPINEMSALFCSWMEITMVLIMYRFFKSWVPTVSG